MLGLVRTQSRGLQQISRVVESEEVEACSWSSMEQKGERAMETHS